MGSHILWMGQGKSTMSSNEKNPNQQPMGNLYPTIPPTGPQQGYPPYQSQGMAPPPAYYPGTHTAPPPQPQPMVAAKFDAGARFHKNAPASIPPPPPGVMPNAAQVAAMQGQSVVMGKKEEGFLKGSGSGGYTFW